MARQTLCLHSKGKMISDISRNMFKKMIEGFDIDISKRTKEFERPQGDSLSSLLTQPPTPSHENLKNVSHSHSQLQNMFSSVHPTCISWVGFLCFHGGGKALAKALQAYHAPPPHMSMTLCGPMGRVQRGTAWGGGDLPPPP